MQRDLAWLNSLTADEAAKELLQCCGSKRWAREMANQRPFSTEATLIAAAHDIWWSLDRSDWLEAFRSHPKIGEKKAADKVSAQSQQWSGQEQSGVANASAETTSSLAITLGLALGDPESTLTDRIPDGKPIEALLR